MLARHYLGKRLIDLADNLMLRVPVLNKIYGTIKQVDAAFAGNKNSFKTVVLIEYPRPGIYSVGFITSEQEDEISHQIEPENRVRFHSHHADSHLGFSGHRAAGPGHQARHERGRRLQIYHQPRRDFAGNPPPGVRSELMNMAAHNWLLGLGHPSQLPDDMIETATGIILRTRPLTETSLIVHWLTPDFGRLATVAKGARRPKSPFAGQLDLFYAADFSFSRSRSSDLHQFARSQFARNPWRHPRGYFEIAAGRLRHGVRGTGDRNRNSAAGNFCADAEFSEIAL